jgi:nitrate reductase gamma subunit
MNYLYIFLEGIFPYIAIAVFAIGTIYRLWQWLKVPVPLRIGLGPAKTTWKAVTGKIAAEVLLFISLLRNDKTMWVFAWVMHVCGLVIIFGSHLLGIMDAGLNLWTPYRIPGGETLLFIAACFSFPLTGALLYFIYKRLFNRETRRISLPTDYFALILILVHVGNGIYMSFFTEQDMTEVMKWGMGLSTFQPYIIQGNWVFAFHCFTAFALFMYFPFSKLFHPLGQVVNRWTFTQKEEPLVEKGAVVK